MKLSDYLTTGHVVLLKGTTKDEAIGEMVAVLAESKGRIDPDELLRTVRQREEMMSTGIGHGLAIPHVRMRDIGEMVMAVGVSRQGIADYQSLDGKAVHIVVLIAAPQGQHEKYIRLLAEVTEVLRHEELRRAIIEAPEAGQVYRILTGGKA